MKHNTKNIKPKRNTYIAGLLVIFFLMVCAAPQTLWAKTDKEIFNRVKVAWFDRNWDSALKYLDQLKKEFPHTAYRIKAMFYRGKCWEEKKQPKKAIHAYNQFLQVSTNESLKEEANISIMDLNFLLYTKGEKWRINKVLEYLKSEYLILRYFAAIKLSEAKSKSVSKKAVATLKNIIRHEEDTALVDRAKIALMRIGPQYLKEISKAVDPQNSMLVIRAYDKKTGKKHFNMSIPFSLAQLAFDALPKSAKEDLKKEGVDINAVIKTIVKSGKLFSFESEGDIFEIGIE